MINTENIKKWDYKIISDNTQDVYDTFNKLYDKDREAARYYIMDNNLSSTRLIVFIKKHVHIIVREELSYGVSISLKRYKSVKILEKYYVDTKTGSISKSFKGKFITCKPSIISSDIRSYIVSKMKWIDFVFKLNLPVTFNTIVTKKLYSQRKLLSWFWGTNYNIALKFNNNTNDFYVLRNNKNIRNINNINSNIFSDRKYYELFINTLYLAKKTMKIINAEWSYKRLLNENKKMNRIILDKLYTNYNYEINKSEYFLPVINYLKNNGYNIPKTARELSKIVNSESIARDYLDQSKKSLIIKKNNFLILLSYGNSYIFSQRGEKIFIQKVDFISNKYIKNEIKDEIKNEINNDIILLNEQYDSLLKMYERKNKIKNIINNDIEIENKVQGIYSDLDIF